MLEDGQPKAVGVEVDGSRTIVQGLDSKTTAKDVISALRLSREELVSHGRLCILPKVCERDQ